ECKVKEHPRGSHASRVSMVAQDLKQLVRKMCFIKASFGYLVTNIQFDDDDERRKVLEEAIRKVEEAEKLNSDLLNKVKLLGKIQGKNVTLEWDTIIKDMQK
ncbi:MAG: hypothetical protein QXF57_01850, partial [Acidilobaceae archaeon]